MKMATALQRGENDYMGPVVSFDMAIKRHPSSDDPMTKYMQREEDSSIQLETGHWPFMSNREIEIGT